MIQIILDSSGIYISYLLFTTATATATASGRDIALSNNQSPVLKFYNTTYSDHDQRLQKYQGDLWNVRGIQLWNDWNYQVHMFAQNHSHLVDYFMMRSEDLLLKRQECFQGLADFVRATMSIQDICCASSAETMVDYGKSSIHTEKHHNFYGSQHGKREPEAGESHLNKDLQAPQTNEQERRRVAWRQAYSMHNLQQGKKELKALDSYLKERQTDLEKINAALQAREISLLRLVASLQENEERHNDRAHENDVGDTNFKRRFLLQEDSNETQQQQQQLSSAAAHFMSNFGQWKERIKTEGDTFDSETLQQMLQIGNSMVNAYQENQAEVRDILALHEILNSIGKLKFLLRQRKPHVNPELFLRGYDTFKTSVEHDYQKLQLASVYRLIEFGNDLAEQWSFIDDDQKKTHPGLKDFNVQNILTLVSSLERLARELELDGGTNYALKERRDELRKKVLYTAQNQAGVNAQHYMGFLGEKGRENVKHRYGKWQRLLANNTKLSEHLHREGAKALEIFGYEPQRKFFYYETPESGSICNENVMC